MSCVTCSKTMEGCGHGIFHCPCCGTLRIGHSDYVPSLVGRCRKFIDDCFNDHPALYYRREIHTYWIAAGIEEAIRLPGERRDSADASDKYLATPPTHLLCACGHRWNQHDGHGPCGLIECPCQRFVPDGKAVHT